MEKIITPDYPRGLDFEQVWAALMESRELQKETDRQIKENAKEFKEWQKESKERQKELDQRMGYLSNRFGELAEHMVAPGIEEKFNVLGYKFSAVSPGGYEIRDEDRKVIAQVDILLENGECIMAVEVKTKPKMQDIEHHIKRLEILRQSRNVNNDKRKIYGTIAGAVFGREVKDACIKAGFYVIEQTGDTMKIDVPEGFVPKGW